MYDADEGEWVCPRCGITDDNECAYGGWHDPQPMGEPPRFYGHTAVLLDSGTIEPCDVDRCPWPANHRGSHGDDPDPDT